MSNFTNDEAFDRADVLLGELRLQTLLKKTFKQSAPILPDTDILLRAFKHAESMRNNFDVAITGKHRRDRAATRLILEELLVDYLRLSHNTAHLRIALMKIRGGVVSPDIKELVMDCLSNVDHHSLEIRTAMHAVKSAKIRREGGRHDTPLAEN